MQLSEGSQFVCPIIDEGLLFEVTLWVNGRASGRSFKPSLLKQSSLSLLISPSSTPLPAPCRSGQSTVLTPIDWDLRKNRMVNLSNTDQGQGKGQGMGMFVCVFVCMCVRPPTFSRMDPIVLCALRINDMG